MAKAQKRFCPLASLQNPFTGTRVFRGAHKAFLMDQKLETFFTQLKSLEALALSISDELTQVKKENQTLNETNGLLQKELQEGQEKYTELEATVSKPKIKPKKQVKTTSVDTAPTLF